MIILQKINKFSEITPEDCQAKLLWLLQCDGERYFFNNPGGEFTKALWNEFQDAVYRYSPAEFEIDCSFDNLSHEDSPNVISGEFSVIAKLLPGNAGFAGWIKSNQIEDLTDNDIKKYFQDQKHLLQSFIQRVLSDQSLADLITKRGSVLEFNETSEHPPWILISTVRILQLNEELSDVQKRIENYNKWTAEQEEKIQYAQQQLEYEVSWANIESAREELASHAKLAEQARLNKIENAKREQQIQQLKYDLQEKKLKNLSKLEEAEINAKIEKMQHECEADIAKITLLNIQIEERRANIRLAEYERKILETNLKAAEQNAAIRQETMAVNLERLQAARDAEKLKLEVLKKQITEAEDYQQKVCDAIKQGNDQLIENIEDIKQMFSKGMDSISSQFALKMHDLERQMSSISLNSPQVPLSLVHIVRTQSKNSKVFLNKESAVLKEDFYRSRDLCIPVKIPEVTIGSAMKFSFSSNISGFVVIICFGTSGKVQLLAPNHIDNVAKIEANKKYFFPGDVFLPEIANLSQDGPVGTEQLLVIVSRNSLEDLFYDESGNLNELDTVNSYQLGQISQRLVELPLDSWAAGYLSYRVSTAKQEK